jgi:Domain of unknown function (DUF4836)
MQICFRNLLVAATVIFFASCTRPNTQGRFIPKEAGIVVHVDGKSLSAKLPWEEIKQNPVFKAAYSDSTMPAAMKMVLNNPDSAGIDTKSDLIFFAQKDSSGGYIVFEGTVKDENLFKTFNKQATENGTESEKDGVNFISKSPLCVGFTKDKFVYFFDAPQMNQLDTLSKRMQQDSIDIAPSKPRDIGAACKAIFDLKENNSLAKNEKFSKLLKESGDIHFWMNTEELFKGAGSNPMMAMVNIDKLYNGSLTTATLNFDNGKISINAKSYAGDELSAIYKKYSGGKISEDMIKRMPGKDVVGLLAINFKPEGIRELLKMTNLDGIANMGLNYAGFTMDDFTKANKGDILFGVSDLSIKTDSVKYNFQGQDEFSAPVEKPVFNFVFATSIGDKDAFNKLINAGKKLGSKELGDSSKVPFVYNSNGTYFTIASSKENADKYLAGANTNFDFINKINGQALGGYLNLQLLLKTFEKQATKDSSAKIAYDASLKLWDNILMKGGDFTDGAITQTIEINLMDKTTNSLKQLNQYAATLGEVFKAKREQEKREMVVLENNIPIEDVVAPVAKAKTKK